MLLVRRQSPIHRSRRQHHHPTPPFPPPHHHRPQDQHSGSGAAFRDPAFYLERERAGDRGERHLMVHAQAQMEDAELDLGDMATEINKGRKTCV
jgi:hypothetical protein